jgi:hypothetical protein
MITTIRRILEAFITALAVVVGLEPDPSRTPVRVRIDRNSTHTR